MKRFFLIFLVVVGTCTGLFADVVDPTPSIEHFPRLVFNADVGAKNVIKVTDQKYVYTTYEALLALDDLVTSSTVINSANYKSREIPVGHLNYFSNQNEALYTMVIASPLTTGNPFSDFGSGDTNQKDMDANKQSIINYMVGLDGIPVAYSDEQPMTDDGTLLLNASNAVYRFGSKPITVAIDQADFDEAIRGSNYSAMIVFLYKTN